jgi:hypothetical protein
MVYTLNLCNFFTGRTGYRRSSFVPLRSRVGDKV